MNEWKNIKSCRYTLAYMGFFCTMVVCRYHFEKSPHDILNLFLKIDFCRINLSIAIVAMTSSSSNETDFSWSKSQQGDLLGCYYYGYVCTQIVGAWLSSRYGFKLLLLASTLVTSILTICSPFLADAGYGWLYGSRVIIGFFHGVTFPLLQGCWSVWGPPLERSRLIAIYVAGNSVGTCLILPLGGLLGAGGRYST